MVSKGKITWKKIDRVKTIISQIVLSYGFRAASNIGIAQPLQGKCTFERLIDVR